MNTIQLKELNDWLDAEIQKYSDAVKDESDIYDAACLISFRRVKSKINELCSSDIYSLIPLDRETADKFIANCLEIGKFKSINESKEHILSYIKENGFSKTLRLAFFWYESDERYDYWLKIYMRTISQKEINEHPVIYDKYKNNLK